MKVWYGAPLDAGVIAKQGIEMDVLTNEISKENPYGEGGDYTFTVVTLNVQCVLNPELVSYAADRIKHPGNPPAVTEANIRNHLMRPRRRLRIEDGGGNLVYEVPDNGAPCDVDLGPFPLHCDIKKVHGQTTFTVNFVIKFAVNECKGDKGTAPPLLLSHRWTERLVISSDASYRTTRTILGTAKFRADLMYKHNLSPDMFRRDLLHPVPPNYRRRSVEVEALPDGTGVNYILVDDEQAYNMSEALAGIGVVKIEAYETRGSSQGAIIDTVEGAAGGVGNFVENLFNLRVGTALRSLWEIPAQLSRALPTETMNFFVRLWGDQRISRTALEAVALKLVYSKVNAFRTNILQSMETFVSQAWHDNFVEVQHGVTLGNSALGRIVNGGLILFGGSLIQISNLPFAALPQQFPKATDNLSVSGQFGEPALVVDGGANPQLPGDGGTRGVGLELAVAQALQIECELPQLAGNRDIVGVKIPSLSDMNQQQL